MLQPSCEIHLLVNMLSRYTVRLYTSLMHASATPHNENQEALTPMGYNQQGEIVPRNFLVLHQEQEIEKYVINLIKNYFRTTSRDLVTAESVLADHGLDALDSVELVVRIEDELGYVIPAEALLIFNTVRSFINYIKQTEDFKKEFNKAPIN